MTISESIKQARETLGMTQEELAEKLDVSRQSVSKWELGASVPSPENLKLLEEALGVTFPPPEETAVPQEAPVKAPFWNWKRVVLLILGALVLSALLGCVMFELVAGGTHTDVPIPSKPYVTGVYFFDEDAAPLRPDQGDGWNSFTAGERVLVMVTFEDSPGNSVNAVSLFLTPTGTEVQREQIAVQAAGEGRDFALFAWDIPEELTAHLEIVLECGGGARVTETLNVATPYPETPEETETLSIPIGATLFMSEPDPLPLVADGAPEEEVVWASSDPAVVEVTDTGALFPVSPGEAVVTAQWNGQTAECRVEVFTETVPTDVPGVSKVVR